MADRQRQQDRNPLIRTALVLGRTHDRDIRVAVSPVVRQRHPETADALCHYHKLQVGALPDHRPGVPAPLIRVADKKIRGHAGIDRLRLGQKPVCSLSVSLYGQVKLCRLFHFCRILPELGIPAVYIAVITARTDLDAAVPRIPCRHRPPPPLHFFRKTI